MPVQDDATISRVLEAARRRLLDTGTRNRLVHVNRANARANCLNIIHEKSDAIFNLLRVEGKRMAFKPMGTDPSDDEDDEEVVHFAAEAPPDAGEAITENPRHTDNFLETPLGPEALAKRLLRLALDARTAEEEQGVNILFLAIGFLRWRESESSDIQRESPLILLPVELIRNERTSTFDLRSRDDDLDTNLPLQERLWQDFAIKLPEIEEGEEWSPMQYFADVEHAVSGKSGWSVDPDGMQLGFFSFAKLLMHRDLNPDNWPDGGLASQPLLRGLLAQGFAPDAPLFAHNEKLDAHLDPAEIIQVIDADASQTKVIEEARRGVNLVVQGPPGTGKSQTITNLIAAAAHDGKTVLFVAEKMAALSVVHNRLERIGLRDICLELHSRSANKKALALELGRTLMASANALPECDDPAPLRASRDELNRIAHLLHDPISPAGETPFQVLSEIIGYISGETPSPRIPLAGLETLDRSARDHAVASINTFTAALTRAGDPAAHPFRGTTAPTLQPTDFPRLQGELRNAIHECDAIAQEALRITAPIDLTNTNCLAALDSLAAAIEKLASIPANAAPWIPILFERAEDPRWREALDAGATWAAAREAAGDSFAATAWDADPAAMRAMIAPGTTSFFWRLSGGYRRASRELAALLTCPLPKRAAERLALVDTLIDVHTKRRTLADDEAWLQSALGPEWRGERTPFSALLDATRWLGELRAFASFTSAGQIAAAIQAFPQPLETAAELAKSTARCRAQAAIPLTRLEFDFALADLGTNLDNAPLARLRAAFTDMADDPTRYESWGALRHAMLAATNHHAGNVVDAVLRAELDPARAATEFAFAWAEAHWNAARQARPDLDQLAHRDRHHLVQQFRELEKDRFTATRDLILSRYFSQVPRGSYGEMGIIRGEIGRKRGHKPVRWMMKNAGTMIQRIKPVMLMSPISVAQFLPPASLTFDILLIDEASQIRPEDALGVIARARQIIVVGDQKQLPPTTFFDRLMDDVEMPDDDDDATTPLGALPSDMESILSLCEARGLAQRMLEWHYRSRDPSLIQVSNAEFYEDRLVLPPSPLQLDSDYGLKFRRVPGIYARGGSGLGRAGTNRIEAEAVADAIAEHARQWPDLSLGVVAFSKAQADMLTEVLELARRNDPSLEDFLREGKNENVFVKNIENVQGDERDVIFISVGYGPQEANGRLRAMTFGPVNGEGGERRLNVLFTRSRVRCEVFASFDPGDIDPSRASRDGPRVLKRFLDFAKSGVIGQNIATHLPPDSPFEADVANVVRSLGYHADPQVGTAGFRIDIGVRHPDRPGQYLVAVECDGASYHSALWARERDRLRQGILENLGWKFHRIWSTDWFHHRSREIERLQDALSAATRAAADGLRVRGANQHGDTPPATSAPEPAPDPEIDLAHLDLKAPPYQRADIQVRGNLDPQDVPPHDLAVVVRSILDVEGPVHIDELTRRVAAAYGRARVGKRIAEAVARAIDLGLAATTGGIHRDVDFLMTPTQAAAPPVRDRSAESGNITKTAYLPPIEITAAALWIREECGDITPDELPRAIARLLGFQRAGNDLREKIEQTLAAAPQSLPQPPS